MKVSVEQLGQVGLVADKEPTSLPPNAWTDMQNVRCVDRSIASFQGYESIATITDTPDTMEVVKTATGINYIVYGGGTSIYSVNDGTETEIGSGFTLADPWYSTILGGVAVFTNGMNDPQYWGGSGNTVDLPYDSTGATVCSWTDADLKAKLIKSFRYHLFAMNLEDCEGKNPRKVWWSHPADPGSVPITWDPTKSEYDAGFVELTDTPGEIVDALALRDMLMIYKSDAIHAATYAGRYSVDQPIWEFRLVTTKRGLYSRQCVVDIGGRHVFVADGDIYLFDGNSFTSIADERVKDLFFDNVSRTNKDKTFAIYYERTQEVWLCYPEQGDTACTKALVWDSIENTWSSRDLPNVTAGTFTVVTRDSGYVFGDYTSGVDTYGDDENTATNTIPPTYDGFAPDDAFVDSLILGSASNLFEMDRTNQANGVDEEWYAERKGLDLGSKQDFHCVLRIYPLAEGDDFEVQVGEQSVTSGAVTYSTEQTFSPGADYKLDFRVTGRLHAIKLSGDGGGFTRIHGMEVDYVQAGRR